ncbi:hypothetical protein SBA4_820016 [Candidatus Sulfopaludibacter sp. SbA4]|nr:hypothetical protein SBA4_820016 [Candidatus Sulfopaludibacter sp. SbA4]
MGDQLVEFFEGVLIEQQLDALARREFAFLVLAGAPVGAASLLGCFVPAAQFVEAIHRDYCSRGPLQKGVHDSDAGYDLAVVHVSAEQAGRLALFNSGEYHAVRERKTPYFADLRSSNHRTGSNQ